MKFGDRPRGRVGQRREGGFTLIETAIVLVILGPPPATSDILISAFRRST
jgi:prepilin-type N-terminal cleavage/methylation domain-containing protein